MDRIINSILDDDLYKFSMQMAVVKKFPYAKVKYAFINRGETKFPEGFAEELRKQIKLMEKLKLSPEEKKWLGETCSYLDPTYLDFLEGYKFNSTEVGIIQKDGVLDITIDGYWNRTILWEVPLMALISELYFKMTGEKPWDAAKREENNSKKKSTFKFNGMSYADFGTRRRFSYDIQDELVKNFSDKFNKEWFAGTSNVHLAMKHNVKPIGTHAHEWFSAIGCKYGYKMATKKALEYWVDVYQGKLGIALSDTYTTDVFLQSFDTKYAKLFDGVRWDSGEWQPFVDKMVAHYNKLEINPMSKVIVFSDNLNPEKAIKIKDYCRNKINCTFGIGTNFSNDVGVKPLNMVIKLVSCKFDNIWEPAIKLSDVQGKHTGNPEEIELCKQILHI